MNSSELLLQQWKKALVFRICVDGTAWFGQLPNPVNFPERFPSENPNTVYWLGYVLGVAVLKLHQPWPVDHEKCLPIDPGGGWLSDTVELIDGMHCRARDYRDGVSFGCLGVLGSVVEMAMCSPGWLPTLRRRIDQLDNTTLHAMAMQAIRGEVVSPNVFEGME